MTRLNSLFSVAYPLICASFLTSVEKRRVYEVYEKSTNFVCFLRISPNQLVAYATIGVEIFYFMLNYANFTFVNVQNDK